MDIDRTRFLLIKYLKIRLQKIERQAQYLISNAILLDNLSNQERIYLTKFIRMENQFFEENILKRLEVATVTSGSMNDMESNEEELLQKEKIETHKEYFRKIDYREKHAAPNLEVMKSSILSAYDNCIYSMYLPFMYV
jgi:hypothetical protein